MTDDTATDTYTENYFLSEVGTLRRLWSQPQFWAKPAAERELAIKALTYVYLHTEGDTLELASIYRGTLDEYATRERYILSRNLQ